MKQTEVIFVRHGETEFNKSNLYFGHLDPSLNETGVMQLEKTKKYLEKTEKNIDVVFCSSLSRCIESMNILELDNSIEKYFEDDLKELNFGIFEGKSYEEICSKYPKEVKKMHSDWRGFKVKNGESLEELMSRAVKRVENIIKENKNKKILIVSHAGVIKVLLSYYLYGNLDGYWKIKIDNGSLSKICQLEDGYVFVDYTNRVY